MANDNNPCCVVTSMNALEFHGIPNKSHTLYRALDSLESKREVGSVVMIPIDGQS